MKYQSKKDNTIIATLEKTEEKYGTVLLKFETGENAGKTISITNSTFKRWWRKVEETKSTTEILGLDMEKINEPYKPDVTPHYIPKPQSVIDYEAKKNSKRNRDLPEFDDIVETFESKLVKVNNNSSYIMFTNKSTLWRKATQIDLYVNVEFWDKLTNAGLKSKSNVKDKERPFAFTIKTSEEYAKVVEALNE